MDQCKGLTKTGFRCRLKTKYGYCRFHKNQTENKNENMDKLRLTEKIKKFLEINQRTKQLHISREFNIDEFIKEEKERREDLKRRIIAELGYGLYGLELKEVIEKNLQKTWTKRQIIRLIREVITNEKIKMEEKEKNKIDFYFVKIDKIKTVEKERTTN